MNLLKQMIQLTFYNNKLLNKLSMLLSSVLLTCFAIAQEVKTDFGYLKNGFLGVSSGVGLPVLEFASKDYFTPSAGYALPGYQWRIFAGYNVLPYLGVRLSYINTKHNSDAATLLENYRKHSAYGIQPNDNIDNVTMGRYELDGVLAGISYPFKTTKTTLDVYFNIGYANTLLPEIKLFFDFYQLGKITLVIPESSAHDLMYTAGVQISHRVYKNILLCGVLDFLYSEQKYKNVRFYNASNGNTRVLPDYTQYYHIVSANIGIAVEFE